MSAKRWVTRREKRGALRARRAEIKASNARYGLFTRKAVRKAINDLYTQVPTERWRNRVYSYKFANGSEIALRGLDEPDRIFSTQPPPEL